MPFFPKFITKQFSRSEFWQAASVQISTAHLHKGSYGAQTNYNLLCLPESFYSLKKNDISANSDLRQLAKNTYDMNKIFIVLFWRPSDPASVKVLRLFDQLQTEFPDLLAVAAVLVPRYSDEKDYLTSMEGALPASAQIFDDHNGKIAKEILVSPSFGQDIGDAEASKIVADKLPCLLLCLPSEKVCEESERKIGSHPQFEVQDTATSKPHFFGCHDVLFAFSGKHTISPSVLGAVCGLALALKQSADMTQEEELEFQNDVRCILSNGQSWEEPVWLQTSRVGSVNTMGYLLSDLDNDTNDENNTNNANIINNADYSEGQTKGTYYTQAVTCWLPEYSDRNWNSSNYNYTHSEGGLSSPTQHSSSGFIEARAGTGSAPGLAFSSDQLALVEAEEDRNMQGTYSSQSPPLDAMRALHAQEVTRLLEHCENPETDEYFDPATSIFKEIDSLCKQNYSSPSDPLSKEFSEYAGMWHFFQSLVNGGAKAYNQSNMGGQSQSQNQSQNQNQNESSDCIKAGPGFFLPYSLSAAKISAYRASTAAFTGNTGSENNSNNSNGPVNSSSSSSSTSLSHKHKQGLEAARLSMMLGMSLGALSALERSKFEEIGQIEKFLEGRRKGRRGPRGSHSPSHNNDNSMNYNDSMNMSAIHGSPDISQDHPYYNHDHLHYNSFMNTPNTQNFGERGGVGGSARKSPFSGRTPNSSVAEADATISRLVRAEDKSEPEWDRVYYLIRTGRYKDAFELVYNKKDEERRSVEKLEKDDKDLKSQGKSTNTSPRAGTTMDSSRRTFSGSRGNATDRFRSKRTSQTDEARQGERDRAMARRGLEFLENVSLVLESVKDTSNAAQAQNVSQNGNGQNSSSKCLFSTVFTQPSPGQKFADLSGPTTLKAISDLRTYYADYLRALRTQQKEQRWEAASHRFSGTNNTNANTMNQSQHLGTCTLDNRDSSPAGTARSSGVRTMSPHKELVINMLLDLGAERAMPDHLDASYDAGRDRRRSRGLSIASDFSADTPSTPNSPRIVPAPLANPDGTSSPFTAMGSPSPTRENSGMNR